MSRPKYRIITKSIRQNGLMLIPVYAVQRIEAGLFSDKWHDVKCFDRLKDAEKLLRILEK